MNFSADQFDVALQAIKIIRGRHRRLGDRNGQISNLNQSLAQRDEKITELNILAAKLQTLRSSRWWRLRDTIRLEPWGLGKAKRIARLSLSLATPGLLRRRIQGVLRRCPSVMPPPSPT